MAVINTGKSFSNGEQLTADKLNQTLSEATFGTDAFDGTSIQLTDVGSKLGVRDLGVSTAKLADDAVTTAKIENGAVTKAKIENVNDMKVLGNVSGVTASPSEVGIIDDDTMATASATTLATSESIKAYVDGTNGLTTDGYSILPGGLTIQWGFVETTQNSGEITVDFPIEFTNACLNIVATLQAPFTNFNGAATVQAQLLSATQFKLGFDEHDVSSGHKSAFWQAIGY